MADLERHAGAGRLTLDEFAERAKVAHGARTLDELAAVVHDLPAESGAAANTQEPSRDLLILLAVAAATLVLLGFLIALIRS
ncbi:hypothetical protein GCM10027087_45660 [Paractinoplanes abujensis]